MTQQRRVPPLVIEWEPGSDVVGDFAWGGFCTEVVARRRVADELAEAFEGFVAEPVEMIEGVEADPASLHGGAKVALPYHGPELCEMWINSWVALDEPASQVVLERTCGTCGFQFYAPKQDGLVPAEEQPLPGFFRLKQFPSWVLCTDDAMDFIVGKGWSNISFREVS